VVDALSRSGLPFLQLPDRDRNVIPLDPAIEAQLLRNQRLMVMRELETVPAKSLRLFICGDPFAGDLICSGDLIQLGRAELCNQPACNDAMHN
jgi:hypothetical protein